MFFTFVVDEPLFGYLLHLLGECFDMRQREGFEESVPRLERKTVSVFQVKFEKNYTYCRTSASYTEIGRDDLFH